MTDATDPLLLSFSSFSFAWRIFSSLTLPLPLLLPYSFLPNEIHVWMWMRMRMPLSFHWLTLIATLFYPILIPRFVSRFLVSPRPPSWSCDPVSLLSLPRSPSHLVILCLSSPGKSYLWWQVKMHTCSR